MEDSEGKQMEVQMGFFFIYVRDLHLQIKLVFLPVL